MTPSLDFQKFSIYIHEINGVPTVFRGTTPPQAIDFFEKLNANYRNMYNGRNFVDIQDKITEK